MLEELAPLKTYVKNFPGIKSAGAAGVNSSWKG